MGVMVPTDSPGAQGAEAVQRLGQLSHTAWTACLAQKRKGEVKEKNKSIKNDQGVL